MMMRMMSGGKGARAINIERFKTYKLRTEFDNWGRKMQECVQKYYQVVPRRGRCRWGWINNPLL
jgi:hypothetical protein